MMRSHRRRRVTLGLLLSVCLCAWAASVAAAEFGPIQLVSKSSKEQAAFAREAAISADGQDVVFYGELSGHSGIFRKNLVTGALTLVAENEVANRFAPPSVSSPSISADGRYVSFTTTESLDPVADPEAGTEDVYVADLQTAPPTYELASAIDGHRMSGASSAAPRVALSADGTEVAFVNEGEVYVRRLAEPEPILISATRDPLTGAMTTEPVPGGGAYQAAGASLSADGNAVAWVGERLPEQVPLLAEEEAEIRAIEEKSPTSNSSRYFEPLWRSVPGGAEVSVTRRMVGGGDPLAPGCGGHSTEAACEGPFPALVKNHSSRSGEFVETEGVGWGTNLPQLSADGNLAAVIGSPEDDNDLFTVDMAPGLSRIEAVRQLTKWTNPKPGLPVEPLFEKPETLVFVGPIKQCAISPDGKHIAFTTERQAFRLNPPTLITAQPSALPSVAELYQLNVEAQTIERVTPGPGTGVSEIGGGSSETGGPKNTAAKYGEAEFGASGPSYSADGRTLAFGSGAINLVAGDANGGSDVFTVESTPPSSVEPSTISPRPPALSIRPAWRLTAHAVSRPGGSVRVVAGVPGAGTLRVRARSRVGAKALLRNVSGGRRRVEVAGAVRLELRLPSKLRKLAHRNGGLYTMLKVDFSGRGGSPLSQQIVARFRAHRPTGPKK